jgi:hypothetical protein
MIKRPNGILINKEMDGKRWNIVFIRLDDGSWTNVYEEYVKTTDPTNLDPFVNWLDYIPDKEWVHPVVAKKSDEKGGWFIRAFDTFQSMRYNDKDATTKEIYDKGLLYIYFDKLLNHYQNMTDEKILEIINEGRTNKLTIEELEKL